MEKHIGITAETMAASLHYRKRIAGEFVTILSRRAVREQPPTTSEFLGQRPGRSGATRENT